MRVRLILIVCALCVTFAREDPSVSSSSGKVPGRRQSKKPSSAVRNPLPNLSSVGNFKGKRDKSRVEGEGVKAAAAAEADELERGQETATVDWLDLKPQAFEYQDLSSLHASGKCVQIPSRMILCRDVGYDKMLIPNFLDHYTVSEAVHQSNSWIGVRSANCHKDIRTFLCSLYAPLCIEGQGLRPCRSMCLEVREACEPSLKKFNHSWPEMFDCDQFPVDDQLCLRTQVDKLCAACKPPSSFVRALDTFCEADFVLRVQVEESLATENFLSVTVNRKVKILKFKARGAWNRRKHLLNRTFHVEGGYTCDCPQLETVNGVRDNNSLVFIGKFPTGANSTGGGDEIDDDHDDDGGTTSGGNDSKIKLKNGEKLFVSEVLTLSKNLRKVLQKASEIGSDALCRKRLSGDDDDDDDDDDAFKSNKAEVKSISKKKIASMKKFEKSNKRARGNKSRKIKEEEKLQKKREF